ncbi:heat shock 70 kDa protein 12A-like [Pelmatolapia mariae]|uniref:heat shock 70 kDa protein 12A-like n=1 Tax=Pelmatolapia mariae TaxID=158779 RepID=UPI002FE62C0A
METFYKNKLDETRSALNRKDEEVKSFKQRFNEMETFYKKKLSEMRLEKEADVRCAQIEREHQQRLTEMETFYKNKLDETRSALNRKDEEVKSFKQRFNEMETFYKKKLSEMRLEKEADVRCAQIEREHQQRLTEMETFYKNKLDETRSALNRKDEEVKSFKQRWSRFYNDSFIIAMQFGNEHSGYAFSLTTREAEIDPHTKYWGEEFGLQTPKTLTCILFNEHEEFLNFGYGAKAAYLKMRGQEAKRNYFFEKFTMTLYSKNLNRSATIKAANGKSMKALKVFTEALRYLKDDALRTIGENTAGRKFTASDFTWVLTVPVSRDPSAKQFMREAAARAGIVTKGEDDRLLIPSEAQAASVWCMKLPADGFIAGSHDAVTLEQTPGTKHIVVNCKGGTIDITVHEVLDGGALKELHKASGNDFGGQTVDRKFKEFLREIFCDGVWDEYERNYPSEVQRIMYDFMYFKQVDDDVEISCPFSLGTLAQRRQDIEKFFESVRGASWDEGSIKISKERLRSFFAESLKGITDSLKEILKKHLNMEYILLVGGYAESQILRQHVIDQFGDQCKVLCPYRPQEAIIKGAVMLGRNPAAVASRKSAFTYGFADSETFDPSKHKKEKTFVVQGEEFCGDIFRKLVEEGEDVDWDETRELIFNVLEAKEYHAHVRIRFYRTERRNPLYVDEEGAEEVGSLIVRMPTTRGRKHEVKLNIKFGYTEITVTGTGLVYGSKESAMIDFMTRS